MNTIKIHLCNFLLLLMIGFAGSQVHAQIAADEMSMSQGIHEGMVLELPGAEARMVEKLWMDFTKDSFKAKTKRDRKSREYQSLNISIPGVSTGSKVDMYAKVEEAGNGSEIAVWIGSNDGWINPRSMPDRYVEAEKMLMRFALEVSKEQIALQVIEEEKALKTLEKELESLQRDKEKYERNIERARQEIADNEAAIVENEQAQEDQQEAIKEQMRVVEETRKKGDF